MTNYPYHVAPISLFFCCSAPKSLRYSTIYQILRLLSQGIEFRHICIAIFLQINLVAERKGVDWHY